MLNDPTKVVTAFETLLKAIEAEIEFANSTGIDGFQSQDYDRIKEVLERVKKMATLKDEIDKLRREWTTRFIQDEEKIPGAHAMRSNLGRLKHGVRTGNEAFNLPILEALEFLGGSAKVSEVLERVHQQMEGVLRDVDNEPDDSGQLRWKNTARCARQSMVKEGLLRNDSSHGVWQISEEGKRFLSKPSSAGSAHGQTNIESSSSQSDLSEEKIPEAHTRRRNPGRLKSGEKTRHETYNLPILKSLESLGGSAQASEVLEKLKQQMKDVLRDADYESLTSGQLRWQNSAQWARLSMVKKGLLHNDSPHGVWQISEKGKEFLSDASSTESALNQAKTESSASQSGFSEEDFHDSQRLDRIVFEIIETGGLLPVEQFIERLEGASAEKVFGIQAADALSPETKAAMKRIRIRQYLIKAADTLARLSIGMAPDPTFAMRGPEIGEPVVLFRLPEEITSLEKVSEKYKDLLVTIEVGSHIAHADEKIVSQERSALEARIHDAELSDVERARLLANLQWMMAVPPDLALFRQRVKDMEGNARHELGQFALAVMVADGVIHPREVEAIEKLCEIMGLTMDSLNANLQTLMTQSESVIVRMVGESDQDFANLPLQESGSKVVLNAERVNSVMANTASVSSILKDIFRDDEIEEEPSGSPEDAEGHFPGLDRKHTSFLRELLTRPHWDEAEFETLTDHFQLMPKGVVETLNEWSFERFGDVLIEEYEGYELNQDVVVELQKRGTNDKDIRFPKTSLTVPG